MLNPSSLYSPRYLKEILGGINLRETWGQHFLIDRNLQEKMVEEAGIKKGEPVLEIGAGVGTLTLQLLRKGAKVYAVEKDPRLSRILEEILKPFPGLKIITHDFLNLNLSSLLRKEKEWKIVSNPPYNLSSTLISRLLEHPSRISLILLTLQREVAEKLISPPGTKNYSLLTIRVNLYGKAELIRKISPTVFFPPPRVDSAIIRITLQKRRKRKDERRILQTAEKIFQKRRKMLHNVFPQLTKKDWNTLGIPPTLRGENLGIEELGKLARLLEEKGVLGN